MGVADGPVFMVPKPGSKPIISDPCGCKECIAGPGLNPVQYRLNRENRLLGPVTQMITLDFCPSCKESVITTATKSGPEWHNRCAHGHTWISYD